MFNCLQLCHGLQKGGSLSFLALKALHIIFVVTWFAGLFYIVRLFVYHAEAKQKQEPERGILVKQYQIMQKRLWYGITWPSALLAMGFGLSLLHHFLPLKESPWLITKLFLVGLLFGYHLLCGNIRKGLQRVNSQWTSFRLRMLNELATLFLVAIVFLVVLKDLLNAFYLLMGMLALSLLLMLAIQLYRKRRKDS